MHIGYKTMVTCTLMHTMSEETLVTLLSLENSTSVAWKHFGFPSREGSLIRKDENMCFANCVNTKLTGLLLCWEYN